MKKIDLGSLKNTVTDIITATPVYDIHTHLYDVPFGGLLLWGIDELLTYHYLVAEVFRQAPLAYDEFWSWDKKKQAEYIWKHLFIENSPVSESCRGVLTCLNELGIDTTERNLSSIREYFSSKTSAEFVDTVFTTGNIEAAVMTNNPFDDEERPVWENGVELDPRFKPALRMDPLLMDWDTSCGILENWGYKVSKDLSGDTYSEIRRFLADWSEKMNPLYMAVSLPPTFTFPEESARASILENCVFPFSKERNIPFAMMIGVKKLTNPELRLAGDSVGKGSIETIEHLCSHFPDNKFMLTYLSRENQHEACIAARKFHNLMLFGCWWYLNNPSVIDEMTRIRMETLGTSFIPQHSDARVLDQLIYKWKHSRGLIADVLVDKYTDIINAGWELTEDEIRRDIKNLLSCNFTDFLSR